MCFFLAAAMTGGAMCMVIAIAELKVVRWRMAAVAEGNVESCNSLDKNASDELMKFSNLSARFQSLLTIALLAGTQGILSAQPANVQPVVAQQMFASPDDAVKALQTATAARDTSALDAIFGPEVKQVLTGDPVQDANNAQRFAAAMAQGCNPVPEGDDKITFEVGTNNWPMPIPLVRTNGQWYFDTAAGREEIINRHIGKDELHAIGVCRAYVTAQLQYAGAAGGGADYAQKFKSAPGRKDGLYWPVAENEPASPFGPLVAEAHVQGYGGHKGAGPHPFHGYYFRILTRQGAAATGGKTDYLVHGNLTGGFALVAYPEHWDQSGIMTFIVNQDGKVYQQNLGEKTIRIAAAMKEYNPDSNWTQVQDVGILDAVSEK
jgi:hypothetical protein